MTIISAVPGGSGDAFAALVCELQQQFGSADVGALAARIFEAEKAEIHWEARVAERYLGQHFPFDLDDEDRPGDLVRVAILSRCAGRWHVGVCIVDGEGCAADCLWLRSFKAREDAEDLFARAR